MSDVLKIKEKKIEGLPSINIFTRNMEAHGTFRNWYSINE